MRSFLHGTFIVAAACWFCSVALGDEAESNAPNPAPATRPEVKRALEVLKRRTPRLPLPPPTDEEREEAAANDRPLVNNLRMRTLYLPKAWLLSWASFAPDPAMTIERVFKTQCFWIVSRGNNCHYCLGHQEFGLSTMMGLSENRIGSLDADWSVFLPKEQAAFGLARKLTLEPHLVGAADVEELRKHFNDREIIELVYAIAGFNSTNRWTDSMGIPQDEGFDRIQGLRNVTVSFDTPTSERFLKSKSLTAPPPGLRRAALEPRAEVEAALAACRTRAARVSLASEDEARAVFPADWPKGPVPEWVRALAIFPKTAASQVVHRRAVADEGRIEPLLKAQIAWTCARHDRAWYALADARRRLAALGQTDDQMFATDAADDLPSPATRDALAFAAKLTTSPHTIVDADIARLRKHFSDHETAEIVYVACNSAMFDRFTETLGLPLDP